jgi:hypothetical protein
MRVNAAFHLASNRAQARRDLRVLFDQGGKNDDCGEHLNFLIAIRHTTFSP